MARLGERELRRRLRRERRKADELLEVASTDAEIAELKSAAQATRDLSVQLVQEAIRTAPHRHRVEQESKAKAARRKAREPASKAASLLVRAWHDELAGLRLDVSRLSDEQGVELLGLVERRIEVGKETGEPLTEKERRRFELLVGTLAGEPGLYERRRNEKAAAEANAELEKQRRRASMPLRRYLARGGVFLPDYLLSWMTEGTLDPERLGVLVGVLLGLENRVPVLVGSRIEDEEGEPVLVAAKVPPPRFDARDGSHKTLKAVRYWESNHWLEVERRNGEVRIKRGERAWKLLEEATSGVFP